MSTNIEIYDSRLASTIAQVYHEKNLQMTEKMVRKKFFPNNEFETKHAIHDLALLRLGYLATGQLSEKNPFSKKQIAIVNRCTQRENCTVGSLVLGTVASVAVVMAWSYMTLVDSSHDTNETKALYATLAAVVNGIIMAGSYWATGIAPHLASNAFNDQQDMLAEMEEIYADLGYKLVELYLDKDILGKDINAKKIAKDLAKAIDINMIKNKITATTGKRARTLLITARLEEAMQYINSNGKTLPKNTQFRWDIKKFCNKQHR